MLNPLAKTRPSALGIDAFRSETLTAVRVLLVEDQPTLTQLCRVLRAEPDLRIALAVSDWWKAVRPLTESAVDLCVIGVSRPDMNAELAIRRFRQLHPMMRIIALVEEGDRRGFELVESGVVSDYLEKRRLTRDLVPTVRRAMSSARLRRLPGAVRLAASDGAYVN